MYFRKAKRLKRIVDICSHGCRELLRLTYTEKESESPQGSPEMSLHSLVKRNLKMQWELRKLEKKGPSAQPCCKKGVELAQERDNLGTTGREQDEWTSGGIQAHWSLDDSIPLQGPNTKNGIVELVFFPLSFWLLWFNIPLLRPISLFWNMSGYLELLHIGTMQFVFGFLKAHS